MAETPQLNIQDAHKYFSVDCLNKTQDKMNMDNSRSTEENVDMLHTAIASLWHWSQREDVTSENLSIGYWQVARVYCLIGQPNNARRYGLLSLTHVRELCPFYKGYAYETLARAEMLNGNRVIMLTHLEKARTMLEQIEDEEKRQLLLNDLETIN